MPPTNVILQGLPLSSVKLTVYVIPCCPAALKPARAATVVFASIAPAMTSVEPFCDAREHPTVLVPVHIVIFPEEQVPVRPLVPTSS